MTRKTIGQNSGHSGRINLSGPELDKFDASLGDQIKVDIAESKDIAHAIVDNSDYEEFIIVSKPEKEKNQ
ncbi:hypothetical protein AUR64_03950 [Haloprofundus marisrubri]|uniref:Uncharacterized protein n=1 Tax=Haloprofundus marisrubri TaxID=1514971 RepID=A0A0W1RD46_9EURY|nr:hypothetical protein AUR64_03950 [Haloprofundus marisrubri]